MGRSFLPAVVGNWALEAGVCDLNGWAVVNLGGQDGSVSCVLVLLWVGSVLNGLCGVLDGLGSILVVSRLGNMSDGLGQQGLGDDGSLGDDWRVAVHGWLVDIGGGLGVREGFVPVIDDASVVFANARVWSVDGL